MYRLRIKITGEQRKALYEQVRNHLAGLGDVFVAALLALAATPGGQGKPRMEQAHRR